MTPQKIDQKLRKDMILCLTIEQYIKSISPVSSNFIAQESSLDLSPATIRNILAELEQDGYLMHPHTSAGRIPTQRGYRYYVDHFLSEIRLLEEEKERIKGEYQKESLELERLLDKTSQILSEETHYTSIISVDGWDQKLFYSGTNFVVGYPDLQDINKIRSILMALDEKERLLEIINRDLAKRIEIFIGQEMDCIDIQNCSLVVSKYRTKEDVTGRIAVLGPTRMNYEKVISTIDYISEIMEGIF